MGIIGHTSVEAFFHEILTEALGYSGMDVTASTEYYLVGLLGEFTKARISDEPMGLRMVRTEAQAERVQALKEIGDTSLYVSGFFAESINRQLVDVDYYIGMGGAAYRELSGRLGRSSVGDVYAELASKFPAFVDVLGRIRSQVNFGSQDVVSLYQEWEKTRADWIEDRLRTLGVMVSVDEDDGYLQ